MRIKWSLPFLDRELFKVVKILVSYPGSGGEREAVANYRLEAENIAVNLPGTKYMLLAPVSVLTCSINLLKVCSTKSPIYTTSGYKMCVMKIFKGHIEMVQEICKINVREKKLPQAVSISDGIWIAHMLLISKLN